MNNNYDESEQWVKGGNCSKCRKVKYCGSECKESKRRINRKIGAAIANTTVGKMFDEINNALGKR